MNGYIEVWVHSSRDGNASFICWQKIVDGSCIGYVDASDAPVILPKVYESGCVTGDLLDAPGA